MISDGESAVNTFITLFLFFFINQTLVSTCFPTQTLLHLHTITCSFCWSALQGALQVVKTWCGALVSALKVQLKYKFKKRNVLTLVEHYHTVPLFTNISYIKTQPNHWLGRKSIIFYGEHLAVWRWGLTDIQRKRYWPKSPCLPVKGNTWKVNSNCGFRFMWNFLMANASLSSPKGTKKQKAFCCVCGYISWPNYIVADYDGSTGGNVEGPCREGQTQDLTPRILLSLSSVCWLC